MLVSHHGTTVLTHALPLGTRDRCLEVAMERLRRVELAANVSSLRTSLALLDCDRKTRVHVARCTDAGAG